MNVIFQSTDRIVSNSSHSSNYHDRFLEYLHDIQQGDLTLGVAMTDAKGSRGLRPHAQANPDAYVKILERRVKGVVISGMKAIVTGGP